MSRGRTPKHRRGRSGRPVAAALGTAALGTILLLVGLPSGPRAPAAAPRAEAPGNQTTFGWPVRPFHRAHPLRAVFGEPRAVLGLDLPLRGEQRALALERMDQVAPLTALSDRARRVLHTGVDVIAPDGTPVYAVRPGVARRGGRRWETWVQVGAFRYVHLADPVATGARVVAFRTVIGRVYPGQEHIDLTHFDADGEPVNPLLHEGLTPYRDTAPPLIGDLAAYTPGGRALRLGALRGPVVLAVRAADVQSDGGARVGLYRLRYAILPGQGRGRAVAGPYDVVRFDALPDQATADRLYTLASTRHYFHPHFWYRLTLRSPTGDGLWHTGRVAPGIYRVAVQAWDARGNTATRTFHVTVRPTRAAPPA